MADVDPNLVRAIAEQVLAAIRVAPGGGASSPAEIHSPIGQCTGDYSKFPELKNLQSAPGPVVSAPVPSPGSSTTSPSVTALSGVITVSHLKGVKGVIRLAKEAMLTPLAADYIKEKRLHVVTEGVAAANGGDSAGDWGRNCEWGAGFLVDWGAVPERGEGCRDVAAERAGVAGAEFWGEFARGGEGVGGVGEREAGGVRVVVCGFGGAGGLLCESVRFAAGDCGDE